MKRFATNCLIVALGLGIATSPLLAEPVNSGGDAPTNPVELNAPVPPAQPPANSSQTKSTSSDDHPPVRIGPDGIHIGGANPVDINVPDFANMNHHASGASSSDSGRSLLDDMIPIVAIVTPFAFLFLLAFVFVLYRFRKQRILHETLRTMIEKGVPIPPELVTGPQQGVRKRADWDLRIGLVMIALGVGILTVLGSHFGRGPGWIPVLVGVAFLAVWFIEKKQNKDTTNK